MKLNQLAHQNILVYESEKKFKIVFRILGEQTVFVEMHIFHEICCPRFF